MLPPMNGRPTHFSLICQLFLVFTFLCAPIADSAHAIRMSQTKHNDTRTQNTLIATAHAKSVMTANAPCHEPMMISVQTSSTDKAQAQHSDDKKPCCPYKQCSPNNCLIHIAVATPPVFEVIPHSPIDSRTFVDVDVHVVSVPVTERLRPPIA